jgi:hypothetical protein
MSDTTQEAVAWGEQALAEIASVKPRFIQKHEWQLTTREEQDKVILLVRMRHKRHPERIHVLKLLYGPGFPRERPRESFVDPNNYENEGLQFWIDDGNNAFKRNHNPAVICLEGTWGFHHVLHKERNPLVASLNKFLLEAQQCFDNTP